MPADEKRKNLGRGLSALLGEDSQDYAQLDKLRISKLVPIEFIRPGRHQPRHKIDEEPVKELAQSIAEKGILQPILVRRDAGQPNAYEIIAGERRWRAAQLVGLHEVPVIVKDLSDSEALEIALIENLQRQDLSPLEEAEGYRRLMEEFAHTQEQLAKTVGKSRSHVANMMRLLGLPAPVKQLLEDGQLTAGHARALLNAPNPVDLAKQIVQRGLNVRQAELLAQAKPGKPKAAPAAPKKDADTLALERDLSTLLGLKVEIKFYGKGGVLAIHYGSLDQLDDILQRLSHGGTAGGGHRTIQTAPPGKPEEAFEIAAMAPESPKAAPTPAAKPGPAKKPAAPPRKVAVAVRATEPKATKAAQAKPAEKKNNNR
jgi:ParB family chromosome partitioning protein